MLTSDVSSALSDESREKRSPLVLWYRQPAKEWVEALPLGNGRIGAMLFGGVDEERLQLNEDTLWAGGPYDPISPEAHDALPEVRRLIFAGKYAEARDLVAQKVLARPVRQMPYQTVGDLILRFDGENPASDYRRELDLDRAVARVTFTSGAIRFVREVFASPVDQVILVRLTADKPAAINVTLSIKTPQQASASIEQPSTLVVSGKNGDAYGIEGKLKFEARVRAMSDGGAIEAGKDELRIRDANSVTLLIAMATSYKRYDDITGDPASLTRTAIEKAAPRPYDAMLADHIAEHRRLFRRVSIDLGTTAAANRPTDERINDSAKSNDPALAALYYQVGRYLLICSSRPGTQPANLQGIWNDSQLPPWGSKYTININTEMNFWPVESTNLAECALPLFRLVKEIAETGATTAKKMYGARGWVAHHNTDLWRATAPIDGPNYGMWPTGGAWLCQNLWEHYLYSNDLEYLRQLYPILKGAAEFFVDTLVEEPTHKWIVTCPSLSPENEHHKGVATCAGPAMDQQILRDLFANCIRASELLAVDEEFRAQLTQTRVRLAPDQISKSGHLQEWLEDWDLQVDDLHHRHVSHLYALFPSNQIDPRTTPELAAPARKSLEIRGDMATGWAIAWRINLWARLGDGERAHKIVKMLLDPSRTYPNMFDAHPPFQIDGNFGGTSGITEMLLQSHGGEIRLLPALPSAWPNGSIKGIRARGGFEVDLAWANGAPTRAVIRAARRGPCRLRYRDREAATEMRAGQSYAFDAQLSRV